MQSTVMANLKEAVAVLFFLVGALLIVSSVSAVSLPGTGSTDLACSIPLVSDSLDGCGTDVAEKYDLETSITVQATDVHANLNERSFEYSTTRSGFFSTLSVLGPDNTLAFGGANDVELDFQLVNSDNVVVADGNKYIGELGVIQSQEVDFDVDNRKKGDYTVKYRLTYTPDFGVGEGVEQVKTLEKDIRIPERLE